MTKSTPVYMGMLFALFALFGSADFAKCEAAQPSIQMARLSAFPALLQLAPSFPPKKTQLPAQNRNTVPAPPVQGKGSRNYINWNVIFFAIGVIVLAVFIVGIVKGWFGDKS